MKKIISLLLVLVVVLGCAGLAACGGGGGEAVPENGGAETTNGGEEPSNGGEEPSNGGSETSGDSLADILTLGSGITSVQYDSVVTSPGADTFTMHVWLKEDKIRTESETVGETIVSIVDLDAQVMYQYFPSQNMAYKTSYTQGESTALTETQSISAYSPTVIGTQTLDGKECLVVEYSASGATVKTWIWKEHGFPIRVETTTAGGTAIVEYKNIEFGDIPDSMFEIPAGVQIINF